MPSRDLTDEQFEQTANRCGFRKEGIEGYYTVVWNPDGTPRMGVSIKGTGAQRVDQLAYLIRARNRYLETGAFAPDPTAPKAQNPTSALGLHPPQGFLFWTSWIVLATVFTSAVFVAGMTVGVILVTTN
jgi:hypothetical protein